MGGSSQHSRLAAGSNEQLATTARAFQRTLDPCSSPHDLNNHIHPSATRIDPEPSRPTAEYGLHIGPRRNRPSLVARPGGGAASVRLKTRRALRLRAPQQLEPSRQQRGCRGRSPAEALGVVPHEIGHPRLMDASQCPG